MTGLSCTAITLAVIVVMIAVVMVVMMSVANSHNDLSICGRC
jgi:Flp pilus assembly pilin Flp